MKKVLALSLVFVLMFAFCGCKEKEVEETSSVYEETIDVGKCLEEGKIPEADFGLTTSPDSVVNGLKEKGLTQSEESYDETSFTVIEGGVSYRIVTGAITYYYNKTKADSGISVIVSYDTAYGLTPGVTTLNEVKSTVNISNSEILDATDDDLFFMQIMMGDVKVLQYKNGNNILKFYFTNDVLFATTIENNNWSLKS